MKLTITGRHIEITEAINDHLHGKMSKTIQDLGESADVHIALSAEKHRHHTEITVNIKGTSVHASEETDDLYTAMDKALVKVEKQLRKHKERKSSLEIKKGAEVKENLHTDT